MPSLRRSMALAPERVSPPSPPRPWAAAHGAKTHAEIVSPPITAPQSGEDASTRPGRRKEKTAHGGFERRWRISYRMDGGPMAQKVRSNAGAALVHGRTDLSDLPGRPRHGPGHGARRGAVPVCSPAAAVSVGSGVGLQRRDDALRFRL